MLPEGCAMCGQYGTNNFILNLSLKDLPVGPRTFCTEKHFAQYAGLPVKESGYYGFEAESFEANNIIVTDKYTHKSMVLVGETANGTPIWKSVTSTGKIPKNARKNTDYENYNAESFEAELDGIELPICCGDGMELFPYNGDIIITCQGYTQYFGIASKKDYCGKSKSLSQLQDGILWEDCGYCGGDLWDDDDHTFKTTDGLVCLKCYDEHYKEDEEFEAESKKINPIEKAGLTGVASGATMEGLETILAAEELNIPYDNWRLKIDGEEYTISTENCFKGQYRRKCAWIANPRTWSEDNFIDKNIDKVGDWIMKHFNPSATEYVEESQTWFFTPNKKLKEWLENRQCGDGEHEWSNDYVRETEYDNEDNTGGVTFGQICLTCDVERRGSVGGDVSWDMAAESFSAEEGIYEVITQQQVDDEMECEGCPHTFKVGDSYVQDGDYPTCVTCAKDFKTCIDCEEVYNPEGEHKWAKTCSYCRGSGFILTSYTSASYDDPADGDGDDCGACDGLGYVCEEGEGYGAESFSAEELNIPQVIFDWEINGVTYEICTDNCFEDQLRYSAWIANARTYTEDNFIDENYDKVEDWFMKHFNLELYIDDDESQVWFFTPNKKFKEWLVVAFQTWRKNRQCGDGDEVVA